MQFSGRQEVYVEIAQRFEQYIKAGIYRDGDKLPSVRTSAGELGVNPNTVARAYALLEAQGYILTLPKKGVYVTSGKENVAVRTEEDEDPLDCRSVLITFRERGVSYESLLAQVKEVYEKND